MGGFGSGRRAGGGRALVEDALVLDLSWLMREGLVRQGTVTAVLSWSAASVDYAATLAPPVGWIDLRYLVKTPDACGEERTHDRHEVRERIALEPKEQRFGGLSWLMQCPVSGRSCRKLYLPPGGDRFAARQVHGLAYASQRQRHGDRALTQARRIRRHLGASRGIGDPVARPKHMRERTFARLLARLLRHEAAVIASARHRLDRIALASS
jgi:hypothetical protein